MDGCPQHSIVPPAWLGRGLEVIAGDAKFAWKNLHFPPTLGQSLAQGKGPMRRSLSIAPAPLPALSPPHTSSRPQE